MAGRVAAGAGRIDAEQLHLGRGADQRGLGADETIQLEVTLAVLATNSGSRGGGICALSPPTAPSSPWTALAFLALLGGLVVVRRR